MPKVILTIYLFCISTDFLVFLLLFFFLDSPLLPQLILISLYEEIEKVWGGKRRREQGI